MIKKEDKSKLATKGKTNLLNITRDKKCFYF
jgi:hypothetical protein